MGTIEEVKESHTQPSKWPVWALSTATTALLAFFLLNKDYSYEIPSSVIQLKDAWSNLPVPSVQACDPNLTKWIEEEATLAWNKIFQQTGAPSGAHEGFVIASPSKKAPDYFYTWTRENAFSTSAILQDVSKKDFMASENQSTTLTDQPSRDHGEGLKGYVEIYTTALIFAHRAFQDGPALRAITLIDFAEYLLNRGTPEDYEFVQQHLYKPELPALSVVKADLEYVARYWSDKSFDLWEEIDGHHFFTYIVSRTALDKGARLALRLDDPHAASYYALEAGAITKHLREFIEKDKGIVLAYKNPKQFNRTGLDAAFPLGVLIAGGGTDEEWEPANEYTLATIKEYVDSFRDEYKINQGEKKLAVATGRYAEDVYDGIGVSLGNPWYLTTLSVSHVLSRAIHHYIKQSAPIQVTPINKAFWAQFDNSVEEGDVFEAGSRQWKRLLKAVATWSEGFWGVAKKYQGENGRLDEQINRDTGLPQGARDLTWSYAAFYLASEDRRLACQAVAA
ncbi:hypothetical protein FRB99_007283 [Tulasnella sp. 403]|nr:hypothetical protein FRB99_007283 [Tulasnella sp. 403]